MNCTVHITGLSNIVLGAELRLLFAGHGTVEDAGVVTDLHTGLGNGEGWVRMASADEAEAAERAVDGHEYMDRKLTVRVVKGG